MKEICPTCGLNLYHFIDSPCDHCAFQHDPNEPDSEAPLDFNKSDERYEPEPDFEEALRRPLDYAESED